MFSIHVICLFHTAVNCYPIVVGREVLEITSGERHSGIYKKIDK